MRLLVIDSNYICYRALYSMGDLSHGSIKTAVVFGFLKEILKLQDEFYPDEILFCFDYGKNKRLELFPEYKKKRKERTEDAQEIHAEFLKQVDAIREEYLPMIGFRNVFKQDGYESDDIIASIVKKRRKEDHLTIISADEDLYQLLRNNVDMYNPTKRQLFTKKWFMREKGNGLHPMEWWRVKVLGGCKTDEVPGIPGIGEKKAVAYLTGTMNKETATYKKVVKMSQHFIEFNTPLVKLPMKGTNVFRIQKDDRGEAGWKKVVDLLGLRSLRDKRFWKADTKIHVRTLFDEK